MTSSQKQIYGIILLRTDGNHITVEEDDFERAYKKWADYRDHWTQCLHEKKPFVVAEPNSETVTAFDPTFVYEIVIRKKEMNLKVKEDNPYYKEMQEKGFTQSFKKNSGVNIDLLDQGYRV